MSAVGALLISSSGCGPSNGHLQVGAAVTSGKVVKITATRDYYNVLVESEGKVVTKQFTLSRVTFIEDVKPGEDMRYETDSRDNWCAVIHVRNVSNDIIIVGTEPK